MPKKKLIYLSPPTKSIDIMLACPDCPGLTGVPYDNPRNVLESDMRTNTSGIHSLTQVDRDGKLTICLSECFVLKPAFRYPGYTLAAARNFVDVTITANKPIKCNDELVEQANDALESCRGPVACGLGGLACAARGIRMRTMDPTPGIIGDLPKPPIRYS